MNAKSILGNAVFATKFLATDISFAQRFQQTSVSLLAANTAVQSSKLLSSVRAGCKTLIIDPMTHALAYQGYRDKPTYRKLPYAPDRPLNAGTLQSNQSALREFVTRVLSFEIEMGANLLVAPYFYVRDLDDGRLVGCTRMLAQSRAVKATLKSKMPLFAVVCVGTAIIENPAAVDEIVRLYHAEEVDGCLLVVENFDDRKVPAEHLMGLARLSAGLQDGRDVLVCSIASYGQVLTALGANGFSAGIGWLETFREVSLQPATGSFPGERIPRAMYYYVPELMSYVNPTDLETIYDHENGCAVMRERYRCQCSVCKKALPTDPQQKREHFLRRRFQEMHELASVPVEDRAAHMKNRISLALELASEIEEDALVQIPTEHFIRWIAVIDALSRPQPAKQETDADEEELDRLIHQVRKSRDDTGRT